MNFPKIEWQNQPIFKKTPLVLVMIVVGAIGFNVYLNLKIKNTQQELNQIEKIAARPPRVVSAEFSQKQELGEKNCPSIKAGNPNAELKFKIFESETCPFCVAQNKVIDELLPEYGDLFYAEFYQVLDCQSKAEQYKVSGVPTFIFNAKGLEKPPSYGFLDKQQLTDYICRVSQKC